MVRTTIQRSFFEQWNNAHASSPVIKSISIMTECLNFYRMGQMHKLWWGIWWKMMILWWNNWPTLEVVMTSHWCSGTIKPYILQIQFMSNYVKQLKIRWDSNTVCAVKLHKAYMLLNSIHYFFCLNTYFEFENLAFITPLTT